ncbi:hypothetical protein SAV31267_099410 [Streptomyces avermitilis]|uniref:Uncharacterized protein n=1 Tax=Streptomyces avermitilis TaxID=33903 RepID=A0A4D4N9J6_STRAX|nr:hypothetical protein SAV31267_099410 [Streptomyces avermitilis]
MHALRTELDVAGLTAMTPALELAAAFHQAVLEDHDGLSAALSRLRELTQNGDHAFYIDIAHFMADLPPPPSTPHPNGSTANTPPSSGGTSSSPPGATFCATGGRPQSV